MVLASSRLSVRATSRPADLTAPASRGCSRTPGASRVDLPAPLGPMMEVTPPAGMRGVDAVDDACGAVGLGDAGERNHFREPFSSR